MLSSECGRRHTMPVEKWVEALETADPEEYIAPPRPDKPLLVLDRAARAAEMTERHASGEDILGVSR